ncbi:dihydrolipoyl dehydrogenase [Pseudobacteriovorax antillogorgiicola]|uniref:Dihydrolipoyl dehydrogenase n=1 Tax=Pseudobacteriovorax antillogorgiicola TaxID=1513793 RepID=A0A1Y6B925_9BACT|nr:dihydrolipoyl dehydrogenase [Pseudobacteriovorax antillogorgiicola]TCS59460.1 dihydrolipoamide dehydrogenase [Pseudobacteriovorax antillogorgiicola]SME88160.1 dihydrolipoamide dehydrogenase [Pseudobacteriovorax antillogorgiicola]
MAEDQFDVLVIGGGPGGYVAAIRAAQLGLKTACIESRGKLGGTCLNVGCIPSKALLQSSESYHHALHKAEALGLTYEKVGFDLKKIHEHKTKVVGQLTDGVEYLFKKNKVTYLKGFGSFVEPGKVKVKSDSDEKVYSAKNVIIATGSAPVELPSAPFDGKTVVDSTGALDFDKVPKHLVVIGGGVIGLELGSVWARLGAKVSVVEAADTILPMMDKDVIRAMKKSLGKEGLEFYEKTKFVELKKKGRSTVVVCDKAGEAVELSCDKVLVAVGRRAYSEGLGLDAVGIETERGKIPVNDRFQTKVDGVWAIGDVIDGPMLAHKAEEEGVACAEFIANKHGHVNYFAIPNVVYTWPEVASVGMTEQECKEKGLEVKIGKVPFSANGRAKCLGETDGFVKIIADKRTDRMVGAHIVGPNASELIGELAIGAEYSASAEDIGRSVHAHPTLSETIKEAALAVDKMSLNA